MKRLLCIVSSMDRGGAETFLMKIYRSIDREKYQFDFCVNKKGGFYDEEIEKKGGRIFVVPMKSKGAIKCFNAIKKIVKDNDYKYVLRTSQESLATLDLIAAKFGGAKILIYRSSNAGINGSIFNRFINKFFFFLPRIVPNVKLAPSIKAAEYVFGKKSVKKGKVTIVNNGLDYRRFAFDIKKREKIRKQLKIDEDTFLYGHVGRFDLQKNHMFLIDIYYEILKQKKDCKLLLIGNGSEKEKVKNKIKNLKIEDNVILLDSQENIQDYFMAMDLLIFPSLYEGMPNVIIEAQATGLRCVLSDTITKEADITGLLTYLPLNNSSQEWAKIVLSCQKYDRIDMYNAFKRAGYLIEGATQVFLEHIFKE